ncbi:hypothetical protein KEF85_05630 [Methylomonas paludis]|uniref:Uncharacterized protein n=1 Tax=Methylomonas paludis TaxID=1173101 RepID=A0A975MQ24_9GAMM|nr:hypothetical protein [Methylomonas paludis]QWF71938.1 hypothetical protein KEF85_05630 [Methylomonas paludis]
MARKINKPLLLGLLISAQTANASVWLPSENVDTVMISHTGSAEIGIFPVGNLDATTKPILTVNGNASIKFSKDRGNWDISSGGQTARLGSSEKFQLGWYANGTWISDTGAVHDPENVNVWQMLFKTAPDAAENTLTVNNVQPVTGLAAVLSVEKHLPVTVWLTLAGFLGFLALNKHRSPPLPQLQPEEEKLDIIAGDA